MSLAIELMLESRSLIGCHIYVKFCSIQVKEGDFIPSELVLIDFDNVGYGFRIFDLLYFISNWGYVPTDDDVKVFLESKLRFCVFVFKEIFSLCLAPKV